MAPRDAASPLLLVAAVALVYCNAFFGLFQFDDYNVIVNFDPVHSWSAWFATLPGIRPLLKLSYTLNWTSGLGRFGFHLFNVACHAGNTLLIYFIAQRWHETHGPVAPATTAVPLLTALIFALHPANTEAVTYISGRSVSLMALFYLAAFAAYLHAAPPSRRAWAGIASPLLFAAALAVKETAWTLPFVILLWELARPETRFAESLRRLWPHFLVLGLAAAVMLSDTAYQRLLATSLATRSLGDNLLSQINGQFYLLTQPLLLLQLNIDPELPARHAFDTLLALKATVLAALAIAGVVQWRRRPWLALGLLWCFLHWLPTNSLLPRLDIANDRQLYLAMIGPAFILAATLARLLRRGFIAAALVVSVTLGIATVVRNHDYRSEIALWESTVRDSPAKARVWNNLGYAYRLAGERDAARRAYVKALELDPNHRKAHYNLQSLDRGEN